jgi:hypothetical protein
VWSDNETDIDLLDFGHLVGAVKSIVCTDRLLPATVGVFGDWGCGKSSLIKIICAVLEKEEGVVCISFNGWLFEGYDDAKTALMGTILDEISAKRKLSAKAKALAGKLIERVDLMKLAGLTVKHGLSFAFGGPTGLGLSLGGDALANAKELLAKAKEIDPKELKGLVKAAPPSGENVRKSITGFRGDFADLLAETKIQRLVVIIDDLDRCTPDTIIETLEAIKLFLFVPHTAFILGADERLVKYAVRRRFPELPGENVEVGRDYLEKLVQFPVRIPPLGRAEMETYINLLFASTSSLTAEQFEQVRSQAINRDAEHLSEIALNHGIVQEVLGSVPDDLAESLSLAERLSPVLTTGWSGNPRQCKRFLNMLLMRTEMAASRNVPLQKRVLAKLMLLEYFKSEWFKRLASLQAEQNGRPRELTQLEGALRPKSTGPGDTEADDRKPSPEHGSRSSGPAKGEGGAGQSGRTPLQEPSDHALTADPPLDPEFALWLTDAWMRDWLTSEPTLSEVDLRPYFYFSRDTLGPLGSAVQRMSPAAQESLTQLLHESEAVRKVAVRQAGQLSPGDAAAVFQALVDRVAHTEDLTSYDTPLRAMFDWVRARPELRGQLVSALSRLPEPALPPSVIPLLQSVIVRSDVASAGEQLLERWSRSTANKVLAAAAQRRRRSNDSRPPVG